MGGGDTWALHGRLHVNQLTSEGGSGKKLVKRHRGKKKKNIYKGQSNVGQRVGNKKGVGNWVGRDGLFEGGSMVVTQC